ncbi:MAG TPA: histidine phosphatase family protein [Micrococcales bacterium]|nr:histidine phosphatase family protein [Micrococcales bacterium]
MTARRVVLWRHGQTDYNVAGRLQGQVDIPLNETGRAQAKRAARIVAEFHPALVVSSDLSRAVATAQAAAELLGLDVVTDARVRERSFGTWEGLHDTEIAERWPEENAAWRAGGHPEGVGAETRGAVATRFAAAVQEHAETLDGEQTLLVVAHGACIAVGITALLGLDADQWAGVRGLGNCHWSVLQASPREPRWRLEAHNIAP